MLYIHVSTLNCFISDFESCEGKVVAIRHNKVFVDEITSGQVAGVMIDQTCFYAEQGGQIFDEGFIVKDEVLMHHVHYTHCIVLLSGD